MSRRPVAAIALGALLALAACGPDGGASSQAPTASPAGTPTSSASPTTSPSSAARVSPATSASSGASVCRQTGDPSVVAVSIVDFEFKPASIVANVDEVVAFSNAGFEPHNATVGNGCATRTLQTGESDGLVFSVPGSYRFGCTIHTWMTGTFIIAP